MSSLFDWKDRIGDYDQMWKDWHQDKMETNKFLSDLAKDMKKEKGRAFAPYVERIEMRLKNE